MQPVGVLFLDLDRFKSVNDTLGHRGGDHFLRIVSDRIARCIKAKGVAGRIGGDEFGVLLPETQPDAMPTLVERIQIACAAWRGTQPSSVSIECSHRRTAPTPRGAGQRQRRAVSSEDDREAG